MMGINLWPAPQISEHCPTKILGRLIINIIWFIRPGLASDLTPNDGIVQECSTSFEEIIIRIGVEDGKTKLFNDDSVRIFNEFIIVEEIFCILTKLGYS